jgi:DnaK suppressor protein
MGAWSWQREGLEPFKRRLEDSRYRLLVSARKPVAEDASVDTDHGPDEIDAGASENSQSLPLRLRARERFLLGKIETALQRIAFGSFGTCDRCGQNISVWWLEARPTTTLCLDCQDEEEIEERRHGAR